MTGEVDIGKVQRTLGLACVDYNGRKLPRDAEPINLTAGDLYDAAQSLKQLRAERDQERARAERAEAAVQKHHDTVWGEHGPVEHDADADLYEAVGIRLGDGGSDD
jgi:hypothetical protein